MALGDFGTGFVEQQLSSSGALGGALEDVSNRRKGRLELQLKSQLIEAEMAAKAQEDSRKYQEQGFASPEMSSKVASELGITLKPGQKLNEKDLAIGAGLLGKQIAAKAKGSNQKGLMGHEANLFLGAPIFADDEFVAQNRYNAAKDQVLREQASPAAKQQFTSIQDAKRYVTDMKNQYDELSKSGVTGPILGNLVRAGNAVTAGSLNPKAAAYMDTRLGLAGRMKGVAGEAGRLTDQDVERMLNLVSGIEKGQTRADEGFKQINQILSGGEESILGLYPTFRRQAQGQPNSGGSNESSTDNALKSYIQGVKAARLAKQGK